MLFPILTDNCVVLLVNVYAVFIVHEGLTLITFKNKQAALPLWILEEHLSVLSYATSVLVRKFVLIVWPWSCYQLTSLISNFFRKFIKISQFLSHFRVFITNKEEGVPHCSQNLTKEKNLPIKPPDVHAQGAIMRCLYYYFFVMSYYIFKMFLLSHVWEVSNCISWVKRML